MLLLSFLARWQFEFAAPCNRYLSSPCLNRSCPTAVLQSCAISSCCPGRA